MDELDALMQGRFHPKRPRPCTGKRGGGDFCFLGAGAGGEELHGLESLDDASSSWTMLKRSQPSLRNNEPQGPSEPGPGCET